MSGAKEGELIECSDPAIRQFLLYLNQKNREESPTKRFLIFDLPPNHLFVEKGTGPYLIEAVNHLINENTFRPEDQ